VAATQAVAGSEARRRSRGSLRTGTRGPDRWDDPSSQGDIWARVPSPKPQPRDRRRALKPAHRWRRGHQVPGTIDDRDVAGVAERVGDNVGSPTDWDRSRSLVSRWANRGGSVPAAHSPWAKLEGRHDRRSASALRRVALSRSAAAEHPRSRDRRTRASRSAKASFGRLDHGMDVAGWKAHCLSGAAVELSEFCRKTGPWPHGSVLCTVAS